MLLDPNPIDFSLGSEANANLHDDTDTLRHPPQNPVLHVMYTIQSKLHMTILYIYTTVTDIEAEKKPTACIVRYVESMIICQVIINTN